MNRASAQQNLDGIDHRYELSEQNADQDRIAKRLAARRERAWYQVTAVVCEIPKQVRPRLELL